MAFKINGTDIYVSKSSEQIEVFRRKDLKYTRILKSSDSYEIGQVVNSGLYSKKYDGVKWESPEQYQRINERAPEIDISDPSDFEEIGNAVIKTFEYCKRMISQEP